MDPVVFLQRCVLRSLPETRLCRRPGRGFDGDHQCGRELAENEGGDAVQYVRGELQQRKGGGRLLLQLRVRHVLRITLFARRLTVLVLLAFISPGCCGPGLLLCRHRKIGRGRPRGRRE